MSEPRILPAGDTALLVEFGAGVDAALSALVLALARRIEQARIPGVIETVPSFRSLLVHFEPLALPPAALEARLRGLLDGLAAAAAAAPAGRAWRLPVCYARDFAPDLDTVAARTGLSPAQVVEAHAAASYRVYMLGFLPGQAYMGDLAPELALPRRPDPRPRIAAGSLAIATRMTCIFPLATPCGWHLIGRSPVPLWRADANDGPGALLRPGDMVSFAPVSAREFERLAAQAAAGTLRLQPRDALEAA